MVLIHDFKVDRLWFWPVGYQGIENRASHF